MKKIIPFNPIPRMVSAIKWKSDYWLNSYGRKIRYIRIFQIFGHNLWLKAIFNGVLLMEFFKNLFFIQFWNDHFLIHKMATISTKVTSAQSRRPIAEEIAINVLKTPQIPSNGFDRTQSMTGRWSRGFLELFSNWMGSQSQSNVQRTENSTSSPNVMANLGASWMAFSASSRSNVPEW